MRPLSARNPRIQRLARLARRGEERAAQRALLVEGPVLLGAALDAQVPVVDVYVDEDAVEREAIAAVLARVPASVDTWVVPTGVLDRVGDATTSQGITAVVERREPPWPTPGGIPFVVVLADVGDPGNAGTLIRTAAAAGAGAVIIGGGVDPSGPKVVRASAGTIFAIDVIDTLSAHEAVAKLRMLGYRTAGMVVRDGVAYDRVDLTGPLAVVLGNEAHGLDPAMVRSLDLSLTIPMAGPAESLNVAMAGSIVCFEVLRQRRHADEPAGEHRPDDLPTIPGPPAGAGGGLGE